MSSASIRLRTSLMRSARPSASTKRSRSVVATNFLLVRGRCADTKARNCLQSPWWRRLSSSGRLAVEDVLVDLAVEADRLADVARVEVSAAVDDHPDLVRRTIRAQHLGIDALVVRRIGSVDGIPRLHQHPPDEVVEVAERLDGGVDDERLELRPLRLPLVPVKTRFDHTSPPTAPPRYLKHPPPTLNSPT